MCVRSFYLLFVRPQDDARMRGKRAELNQSQQHEGGERELQLQTYRMGEWRRAATNLQFTYTAITIQLLQQKKNCFLNCCCYIYDSDSNIQG